MTKYCKHVIAIALLAALCLTSAAQSYHIRVTYNTNIRAEPSLDGARLETATAGTTLEVLNQFNRWLRINRPGEAWMAAWVSHERVEGVQPLTDNCCGIDRQCQHEHEWVNGYWAFQNQECQASVPVTQTNTPIESSTDVDNCCFTGWVCQNDHEWINGYWAFQNQQCQAPATITQTTAPIATDADSSAGNCCLTGWICHTDQEWNNGHMAFQLNKCMANPILPAQYTPVRVSHEHIRITELTAGFAALANRGFDLLKRKAPEWYVFAVNGLNEVREVHTHAELGVTVETAVGGYHHAPANIRPIIPEDDITMAEFLVHEACHVYQYREGRAVYGWHNEWECSLNQLEAALLIGPVPHHINALETFIADPTNRALWWWD